MTEPAATVTFFEETFALPERLSSLAIMRFSKGAQRGVDSGSPEGLVLQYDLLQQCIAPEDWERFEQVADQKRANGDDLWKVITQVLELMTDRPTSRPSDSSDGPPVTHRSFESASEEKAIQLFPGRPDLQIAVQGVRAS